MTERRSQSQAVELPPPALEIARDALAEIALAGMSGSGQESEEGMRDWHARRAWDFIAIAARAKTKIDAAIAQDRAARAQGAGEAVAVNDAWERALETAARACEKLAEERFNDHGTREPDTGACYYGGRVQDEYETRDEEDDECAKAIRALATPKNNSPRFSNIFCSQCGRDFGPGEHGYSHCENHAAAPTIPQAAEVPGFVLVPRVLTEKMLKAGGDACLNAGKAEEIALQAAWRYMLAAAPTPTASAACPHGDRFCPCPDGDTCHYEGANPLPAPKAEGEAAKARCDAQDALYAKAGNEWQDIWLANGCDKKTPHEWFAIGVEWAATQPPSEVDRTREGGDVVACLKCGVHPESAMAKWTVCSRGDCPSGTTTSEGAK
jgi:hypothetical protein